jgi:LmbE family N-acetylglucosaminyl deacetylase
MARLTALCVVAHPDDCVIFARPFIERYSEFEWTILYLTYRSYDPRAMEMTAYWRRQNVATVNLGFTDDYRDMKNNLISFDAAQAQREIFNISSKYDLVLTHNWDGDYGHIHHTFVSNSVHPVLKPKVYFAKYEQSNMECCAAGDINLTELPLHREIISGFENINVGRYFVDQAARELLNGKP